MADDAIKKAIEANKILANNVERLNLAARIANQQSATRRLLEENKGLREMLDGSNRNAELLRAVATPLDELRRLGMFNLDSNLQRQMKAAQQIALPQMREMERARKLIEGFDQRFLLPRAMEVTRLIEQFQASPASKLLERYNEQASNIEKALKAMNSPWLEATEKLRSVGSFTQLHGIGHILAKMPVYSERLTNILRVDLGDWRDRINWSEPIFTDLVARSEFYLGLGFDPGLTNFPASAFHESLDVSGLNREPPSLIDLYGPPVPHSDDDREEEGLERTNQAHDWLLRLETQLRRFIDNIMADEFGPNWPRHRLPKELYEKWQEKKKEAEQGSAHSWPLIAYADFTDYELVICKRDNWREVFKQHFARPENVRESLQRLYPIRVCTMHARLISQDDELLLFIEVRRLINVIS